MEVMIARVLVAMLGLAVIAGAVLRRPKRPHDNIPFGGGPAP